ncbi:MAG: TIGR02270 family protein [Rhodocyclaceae bacterium]
MPATIDFIVNQHAELSAQLWLNRRIGVTAPNWSLFQLGRCDERIEANVDGLRVAGKVGWRECAKLLDQEEPGGVFVAAILAIEAKDQALLDRLLRVAEASPSAWAELGSALAWVSGAHLKGTVKSLLDAGSLSVNSLGITACVMHRVDPGAYLDGAINSDLSIRAPALEAIGRFGRRASLNAVLKATAEADGACRSWGAWSAVVLGDRATGLHSLREVCNGPSAFRQTGLAVLLRVLEVGAGRDVLRGIAQEKPKDPRILVQGAGMIGDPHFVPWLMEQMEEPSLSRLAGQAFTLVTGADLVLLDLERSPPEDVEFGPIDNPEDENVSMDPDDGLPWPDPAKVRGWWHGNQHRFVAGERYFMGQPPNLDYCQRVLRDGCQPQRIAAALYMALLRPGTPLFPTAAPAWRQKRWLAQASA